MTIAQAIGLAPKNVESIGTRASRLKAALERTEQRIAQLQAELSKALKSQVDVENEHQAAALARQITKLTGELLELRETLGPLRASWGKAQIEENNAEIARLSSKLEKQRAEKQKYEDETMARCCSAAMLLAAELARAGFQLSPWNDDEGDEDSRKQFISDLKRAFDLLLARASKNYQQPFRSAYEKAGDILALRAPHAKLRLEVDKTETQIKHQTISCDIRNTALEISARSRRPDLILEEMERLMAAGVQKANIITKLEEMIRRETSSEFRKE